MLVHCIIYTHIYIYRKSYKTRKKFPLSVVRACDFNIYSSGVNFFRPPVFCSFGLVRFLVSSENDRQQLQFAGQELRVAGQKCENAGQGLRLAVSVVLWRRSFLGPRVRRRRNAGPVNRDTGLGRPNRYGWLVEIQGQQKSECDDREIFQYRYYFFYNYRISYLF